MSGECDKCGEHALECTCEPFSRRQQNDRQQKIKQSCRSKSNNLLNQGKITKVTKCQFYWCEGKRNNKLQMHHEDYTKPDWVVWLCGSCHKKYHKGTIIGPKDLLFSWNWRSYKEYNPKYFDQYK